MTLCLGHVSNVASVGSQKQSITPTDLKESIYARCNADRWHPFPP